MAMIIDVVKKLKEKTTLKENEVSLEEEAIENLPNTLSDIQFEIMERLLEGNLYSARKLYRLIAHKIIDRNLRIGNFKKRPEKKSLFGKPDEMERELRNASDDVWSDEQFETFFSKVRKYVKAPAYNTIQKNIEWLKDKNLVEEFKEGSIRQYGLNQHFFQNWKRYRKKLVQEVKKEMEEIRNTSEAKSSDNTVWNEACERLGLRYVDKTFFRLRM